jgi:predicted O-methyltransferase YrrM
VLALRGNISAHQGQRISACIGRHGIERTLEVGFAYGISSCIYATRYPISRIPITS